MNNKREINNNTNNSNNINSNIENIVKISKENIYNKIIYILHDYRNKSIIKYGNENIRIEQIIYILEELGLEGIDNYMNENLEEKKE